jgi:type I restriction enzyme S subunit
MVAVGNAQKTITLGALGSYQVPVPSLSEQKDIVQVLSDANEQLETLRAHKTHLESLKAQAINRLLTGQHDAARAAVGVLAEVERERLPL